MYVILENDKVFALATTLEKVAQMIEEYYKGSNPNLIKYEDIRDSGVEYRKVFELDWIFGSRDTVTVEVLEFKPDEL